MTARLWYSANGRLNRPIATTLRIGSVRRALLSVTTVLGVLAAAPAVRAGMPAPLPTEDEGVRVLRLNETADQRLQAISFFLAGLLVCAALVRWLWNAVARDVPALPRLSYGKALAGVVLWGLLFVIVLAMIAGARELMTPGAWKKQGFTYKLADGTPPADPDPATLRRQHLDRLRAALWHFAATHQGRFPSESEAAALSPELWEVPESGGLRYRYVAGLSADQAETPLVIAPELEPGRRLVLRTNGTIADRRTPAMWASLTGHPWTLAELLENTGVL
jgi:hypothetical protein